MNICPIENREAAETNRHTSIIQQRRFLSTVIDAPDFHIHPHVTKQSGKWGVYNGKKGLP
jgi:hypothetical protein